MNAGGCGGAGQDPEEEAIPAPPPRSQICVRCSEPATCVFHLTSYCTKCFVFVFEGKVMRGFEPARKKTPLSSGKGAEVPAKVPEKGQDMRPSAMIALSGGSSSRTMMAIFKKIFVDRVPPKKSEKYTPQAVFKAVEVVWVDESGVPNLKKTVYTEAQIRAMVEPTGFPFLPISLSSVASESTSLSTLFSSLPSTSSASFHNSLLHTLLRSTAASRGHSVLLLGESSTRIAVRTLSGVAEGRGWSLGEEVASEWGRDDSRSDDVMTVRPLGGIGLTEVKTWAEIQGWEAEEDVVLAPGTTGKQKGIEQVCKEFVLNLDASFPSTVPTIMRTAGKLGLRTNDSNFGHELSCPICGLPAQPGAHDWRTSITVSSFTSSDSSPSPTSTTDPSLSHLLCYGCLLVYEPLEASKIPLPEYVALAAKKRIATDSGRSDLKQVVQEFLLEDDDA